MAQHVNVRGKISGSVALLAALAVAYGCSSEIPGEDLPSGGAGGPPVPGTAGNGGPVGSAGGPSAGASTGGTGSGGTTAPGTAGAAGGVTTPPGVDPTAKLCADMNGVLNVGVTKMRRLTRDQFNNTVRDLIGATGNPAELIAQDERIGPFHSNASSPITDLVVQQHQEAAAKLATEARARMAQIAPCDLAADMGTTCSTRFVTEFGQKAYRRPLDTTEVQKYVALYNIGKAGTGGAQNGFRLVIEAMLQSPFFLYHHDVGASGTPQANPVPVTGYELASRLSYFLWNSMPDASLFSAAANNSILDKATISSQVERMLADPKASANIALFHRQWLGLSDLAEREKNAAQFPQYNAQLANAMLDETGLFANHVIQKGDGLLKTLLTSNVAFPQGGLFAVYGATQPAGYTVGTPVMLDATRRAGILTQAAFLARQSHGDQTSPVHRGLIVRENILCQPIPSPPADVNTTPPIPTPNTSTRQRFAQHVADPTCANCHALIDPLGLPFEHYDPIGAYRTRDGLGDVDATGSIAAVAAGTDGPVNGALELVNKLAQSREVADCVSNQWFRYSLGRMESQNDACSVQSIREGFNASGGNIRAMIAQIAVSEAFRSVRSNGG